MTVLEKMKEDLKRMEARLGADAPFVKAVRQQIANLESQPQQPKQTILHAGARSTGSKAK